MTKLQLRAAVIAALALLTIPARAAPDAQCYSRAYSAEHLEKHPQQTVTSVTLSLYTGENAPQKEFWIWVSRRTDKKQLYTGGSCATKSENGAEVLSCTIDCDGGGIGIVPHGTDGSVLVHLAPPLGFGRLVLSDSCGEDADQDDITLTPGSDDKAFKLDPAPSSVCKDLEATLPAGDDDE